MTGTTRWWSAGLLAAALVVAGGIGSAGAEIVEAKGVVTAKDVTGSRVEVDGRSYAVGPTTVLEDLNGQPLALTDLPVEGGPLQSEAGAVEYRATRTGRGWMLLRLRLIGELPK